MNDPGEAAAGQAPIPAPIPAPGFLTEPIPITTTFDFPGWRIERWLGPCFGLIVRSMGFGNSLVAGFRGLARTEMVEYTHLLEDSRKQAIDRLVGHAMALGANGVVGMRFDSSDIGGQFTEIVAYGTAVLLADDRPGD